MEFAIWFTKYFESELFEIFQLLVRGTIKTAHNFAPMKG